MTIKPLTEHHLELLSFKRGCTSSSESTLVKMPHCWKSHVVTHIHIKNINDICTLDIKHDIIWTLTRENLSLVFANNLPAHMGNLISAFVDRLLDLNLLQANLLASICSLGD